MSVGQSLILELEEAIQSGSKDKRVDALRRITDLFVADADRLNDQQIDVFDDILGHLIKRIESKALAELSRRLAPIHNAPIDVVRRLAGDDNITVAEPILTASARLSDHDLIEIASTKTQAHLLAISARPQIGAAVTDVLLQRGNQDVFHTLAENSGARFSEGGLETLVQHAERDERLAEKVGLRLDVPLRLFRELLSRATEAVRARLLALAGPESRTHIQGVLSAIAEDARYEARRQSQHDYATAPGACRRHESRRAARRRRRVQVCKQRSIRGHRCGAFGALRRSLAAHREFAPEQAPRSHSDRVQGRGTGVADRSRCPELPRNRRENVRPGCRFRARRLPAIISERSTTRSAILAGQARSGQRERGRRSFPAERTSAVETAGVGRNG